MKKLDYIDGMKGIGAIMVYFCHFVYAFYYGAYSLSPEHVHTRSGIELVLGRTPLNFFYNGNTAVCIFLVLSGFVLCLSYFKTKEQRRLREGAIKRYFRLMPMILAVNVMIFILMSLGLYRNRETAVITGSIAWFGGFNQFEPDFFGMLKESLAGCFIWGSNDYNGVLWTIPYLFLGALVVYLAVFLAGENRLRYFAYGVMLLVSLKTDIYFAGIFSGLFLCDFFMTQDKWMALYRKRPAVPVLVFLLGFYLSSYPSFGASMEGTVYGLLPPAYTVIYHMAGAVFLTAGVLGSERLKRFFSWKPFVYLGKISFSLYLIHFPVIAVFSCRFFLSTWERLGYHPAAGIDFVLTTAFVILLSVLCRRYLEPAGKLLEDWVTGTRKNVRGGEVR